MVSIVNTCGPQVLAMLAVILILYRVQKYFTLTTLFLAGIKMFAPLTEEDLKKLAEGGEIPAEITDKKIIRRRKPNKKKPVAAEDSKPAAEDAKGPKRNSEIHVQRNTLEKREVSESHCQNQPSRGG